MEGKELSDNIDVYWMFVCDVREFLGLCVLYEGVFGSVS